MPLINVAIAFPPEFNGTLTLNRGLPVQLLKSTVISAAAVRWAGIMPSMSGNALGAVTTGVHGAPSTSVRLKPPSVTP